MKKRQAGMVACPHCGEMIKSTARACPHCGSDERTGWSEETYLDGVDLPDDVDYDLLAGEEFGVKKQGKQSAPWWRSWKALAAAGVLAAFALAYLKMLTAG
jgi:ribosomal protein L32